MSKVSKKKVKRGSLKGPKKAVQVENPKQVVETTAKQDRKTISSGRKPKKGAQ